ncbi:MAG: glycosyltransferase [Muribaculaceae bacterium]|nr:glycosyltransferase [Muribaculaceae bacterium]
MTNKPKITVIVAVYNNPRWLHLILDSLRNQRLRSLSLDDIEVVVADDGSSHENVKSLRNYIKAHPELHIIHSWHADEGWRKNLALNNALRSSSGEYVIFVDGDCIPHRDFVEDHYRMRRPGFVIGGRRLESGQKVTDMIETWDSLPKNFFSKIRFCILKNFFSDKTASAIGQLRRSIRFPFIFGKPVGIKSQGFLGANFAIHRSDLEKVNGFDERYVDPGTGEDTDLDLRLENAGILHLKAARHALMVHRHHKRLDLSSKHNVELYQEAVKNGTSYVATGLCRQKCQS